MKNNKLKLLKFFKNNLFLVFKLIFKEKQISFWKKLIPIIALIYLLIPVDFIPEILNPILGLTDDVVLIIALFKIFLTIIPTSIKNKYKDK